MQAGKCGLIKKCCGFAELQQSAPAGRLQPRIPPQAEAVFRLQHRADTSRVDSSFKIGLQ
jgi:hypothetical protein